MLPFLSSTSEKVRIITLKISHALHWIGHAGVKFILRMTPTSAQVFVSSFSQLRSRIETIWFARLTAWICFHILWPKNAWEIYLQQMKYSRPSAQKGLVSMTSFLNLPISKFFFLKEKWNDGGAVKPYSNLRLWRIVVFLNDTVVDIAAVPVKDEYYSVETRQIQSSKTYLKLNCHNVWLRSFFNLYCLRETHL